MERKKKQGGVLRTILKYRSVVIGVLVSTLVLLALLVLSRPLDTEAVERAVRAHGHSTRTLRDGGFGSDKEQQAVVNQVEQGLDPAGAEVRTDSLKLLLASHGRLMWYFPHTNRVRVLHEGGGVHYGVFPGSRTSSVLRTLWFVHRPHNWHPNTSEEWLREVDVETGREMKHVRLRSRFTHDAARAGDSVHVCNTEAGEVQTLAYPTMDLLHTARLFSKRDHINTLAPLGADQLWGVLHNLGKSDVVRLGRSDTGSTQTFLELGRLRGVGTKAHGLVAWGGGLLTLDSEGGRLVWLEPLKEVRKSEEMGDETVMGPDGDIPYRSTVMWEVPGGGRFLKGLAVVDDVAYFGVSVWAPRQARHDPAADSELAAFDLRTRSLLWRRKVPTHGLLNIVAAPHLGDASTYAATSITDGNAAAAAIAATLAAMPAVTGHVAGRGVEVPQSDTDRRAAGRAAAGGEPGLQHGKQRVGAHMTGTDTVSEADVTKKSWEGEAGTDEAAGGDVLGEQAAGDGRGNGDTGRSLHTGGRGKARGGLHAGREGRAGLGGDAGAEAGQGLGKQKMSLIAPGSSLPAIHAINSSQVEEVTRKLTAVGFEPKLGGHWPSGQPYLDLVTKAKATPWEAGIQLPLMQLDIAALQAKIRALPQEWWTDSHQRVHNAMVEGRQDNLDKFKPGVGGIYLVFSDYNSANTYRFPFYEHFKQELEPLVHAVIGASGMKHMVRLQFAHMPPGSLIRLHRDMGGYALRAHRIHVPIFTNDNVTFEVCPGLERRVKGRHARITDEDVRETGDCTSLYMAEGQVFELNNRVLHRVFNRSPVDRVQLVLDVAESPRPCTKLRPGAKCNYVRGRVVCPEDGKLDQCDHV